MSKRKFWILLIVIILAGAFLLPLVNQIPKFGLFNWTYAWGLLVGGSSGVIIGNGYKKEIDESTILLCERRIMSKELHIWMGKYIPKDTCVTYKQTSDLINIVNSIEGSESKINTVIPNFCSSKYYGTYAGVG